MLMSLYQKLTPLCLRKIVYKRMAHGYFRQYKERLDQLKSDSFAAEKYRAELDEIYRLKAIYMINRDYRRSEYCPENVEVKKDAEKGLRYVLVDGKRLYYPRKWSVYPSARGQGAESISV